MPSTATMHRYALALGSNRALSGKIGPRQILQLAVEQIEHNVGAVTSTAPIITTAPIGPSLRHFANGAVIVETRLSPPALLQALQAIEQNLGRRRHRRWGARTLDIDIILWSGGVWNSRRLQIPHRLSQERIFVLKPLSAVASTWRFPRKRMLIRHICEKFQKPLPKCAKGVDL